MRWGSMLRQNGKEKAHTEGRSRQWTERAKEGNHQGEATDSRRQEPERPMMEMNEERQLGGLTSESVRRTDRGTVSFKENLVASESEKNSDKQHPSHGLRSLNIYITQCQRHKEAIRERESGLCTGPDMAGHLRMLHKFSKNQKSWLCEAPSSSAHCCMTDGGINSQGFFCYIHQTTRWELHPAVYVNKKKNSFLCNIFVPCHKVRALNFV